MKKLSGLYVLLLVTLSVTIFSCKKPAPEPVQPKSAIQEYIRGYFGSEYITFDQNPLGDDAANIYYFNEENLHQIGLIRSEGRSSLKVRRFEIYISETVLDSMSTPMVYDRQSYPQQSNLMFIDGAHPVDTLFGPNDKYNYSAVTCFHPVQLTVTERANDIIKGTFEGIISTRTGIAMNVKQGEFCIKIKRKKI